LISLQKSGGKKEFKMKNFWKIFGIIAIVAIIGFGVVSCEEEDSSGGEEIYSVSGNTYTNEHIGSTWVFKADGTATLTVVKSAGNTTIEGTQTAKWTEAEEIDSWTDEKVNNLTVTIDGGANCLYSDRNSDQCHVSETSITIFGSYHLMK
jgi:hypothetical protein